MDMEQIGFYLYMTEQEKRIREETEEETEEEIKETNKERINCINGKYKLP